MNGSIRFQAASIRQPARAAAPAFAIQTSSIEAWPAAGGGLFLGMIIPPLAGAAPLNRRAKSAFLRIGMKGAWAVIIPYVRLEHEAQCCAAELVAAELNVRASQLTVSDRGAGLVPTGGPGIADLCPPCELGLTILAAAARALLRAAAGEIWSVAAGNCTIQAGVIACRDPQRSASYGELAGDAALLTLPDLVTLRSGQRISAHGEAGVSELPKRTLQ